MEKRILEIQRAIAQILVRAQKITAEQAESMAPSDSNASIISDLCRIAKDDEAVSAAVANHLNKKLFNKPEVGVDFALGEENEDWLFHGDTIYLVNVLDQREISRAFKSARNNGFQNESIGVISASKLESLRISKGAIDQSAELEDHELERKIISH